MVEIIAKEKNKGKRTERFLRDICDNIKWTKTYIIGVPEEELKQRGGDRKVLKKL